ncbi:hypothetical protein CUJ83_12260 [Methanocella sp. CWC-04]|uniref:DUF3795 domain-containing protein n=1 Tax=Methanooceanicella nereidis TaxID=2052831 RepID=A0AAP2RGE1_9EURY|nr:DUF3795 domain-containing protein [Methanocella sp. CWC-04]MCD1295772.1 hypothetical protein [Methanocella sp. CWC-04]
MAKKQYDDYSVKYALAAPCGMYCGFCRDYLAREKGLKKGCEGCRIRNKNCAFIKKDCPPLRNGTIKFCYECESFPCDNLKRLDSNYTKKCGYSMIKSLERIRSVGVDTWLGEQWDARTCPACGGRICIHDAKCFDCGAPLKK